MTCFLQIESLRSTCNLTDVILMGKDIELLLLKKDVQGKLDSLSAIQVKDLPATVSKVVDFVAGTIDLGYLHDFDRPLLSKMRPRRANAVDAQDAVFGARAFVEVLTSTSETQTDPDVTKLKVSDSSSESSTSDSSDNSSDDSDDSDSESDNGNKSTCLECGVQTELNSRDSAMKIDQSTMTDLVLLEEKAISTRSQGLMYAAGNAVQGSDSADDTSDNSLAARRRRRRERAQTAYIAQDTSENIGPADESKFAVDKNFTGMSGLSLLERRKLRSTYVLNHHSVDAEDVFYDAMSSKNT
jgi:hypothetical protein